MLVQGSIVYLSFTQVQIQNSEEILEISYQEPIFRRLCKSTTL